jgi:hypothetical protein
MALGINPQRHPGDGDQSRDPLINRLLIRHPTLISHLERAPERRNKPIA